MSFMDIRFLFTRDKMIKRLQNAKPIPTVVMDAVFSDRPQLASATVPVEDVSMVVRSMPVIQRGGASIAMATPGLSISGYEPLPISLNIPVSAADINTLRQYDAQGLEAWAASKTETLRRTVRNTTEGIAAQALNGKVEWPIQLAGGGYDLYTVDWGRPIQVTAPKRFDDAGAEIADAIELLTLMRESMQRKGFGGGAVKVWAGKAAFFALMRLVQSYEGDVIKAEIKESAIAIAGTEIVLRGEMYPLPGKKDTSREDAWAPVQNAKTLRMIDAAGGHQMPYCALDDLDAKLAPLPLFIKPIKQDDPSGYKLVAQSKPFPVPNMAAVAESTVTA